MILASETDALIPCPIVLLLIWLANFFATSLAVGLRPV
nr:MAG: hypothetical protein [Bacteriophage sp.]